MTPEQIDKMPAGREMDVVVAEATGWRWYTHPRVGVRVLDNPADPHWIEGLPEANGDEPLDPRATQYVPRFSTDIAAAWLVLDHLDGPACDGRAVVLRKTEDHGQWEVDIGLPDHAPENYRDALGMGETAPLAICRAFLRWKTFDVPAPLPGERGGEEVR